MCPATFSHMKASGLGIAMFRHAGIGGGSLLLWIDAEGAAFLDTKRARILRIGGPTGKSIDSM